MLGRTRVTQQTFHMCRNCLALRPARSGQEIPSEREREIQEV